MSEEYNKYNYKKQARNQNQTHKSTKTFTTTYVPKKEDKESNPYKPEKFEKNPPVEKYNEE